MEYRKKESKTYNPLIIPVKIGNSSIKINYSELTDESCLEFYHVHSDYEIYYCLEGNMYIMAGEECLELHESTFTIINPGVYHNTLYQPKSPKKYFIFVFEKPAKIKGGSSGDHDTDKYLAEIMKHIDNARAQVYTDKYGCETIVSCLEKEMQSYKPGQEDMIKAFYLQYLVNVFRNFDVMPEKRSGLTDSRQYNINLALEMTRFMHENYNKNISIKDAAEAFHISERHVGRIFDKYFSKSFKNTLNIYRINYAKNYLLDTDYSIEKIAALVGISSTRTFHELFKEMENMSASKYRKIHKGNPSHYGIEKEEETDNEH